MTGRSSVGRAPAQVPESQKAGPSRRASEKSPEEPGTRDTINSGQSRGVEGVRHALEVAGSNPDRPDHFPFHWPEITWGQRLGPEDCPYLRRWVLDCGVFTIRLHHWLKSDDLRHPHDHPWNFWSLVLWGTVSERTAHGTWRRPAGSLNWFPAEHQHCVEIPSPAWTLLLTSPEYRRWGFWVNGRFRKRNKFFYEHGHHHPCDPTKNKIRRRDR